MRKLIAIALLLASPLAFGQAVIVGGGTGAVATSSSGASIGGVSIAGPNGIAGSTAKAASANVSIGAAQTQLYPGGGNTVAGTTSKSWSAQTNLSAAAGNGAAAAGADSGANGGALAGGLSGGLLVLP